MKPMIEPRRLGNTPCLSSLPVGKNFPVSRVGTLEFAFIMVLERISPIPNTPMIATIGSMPSNSVKLPKVNRGNPDCSSMPTVEIATPITTAVRPSIGASPTNVALSTKAITTTAKYTAGPKARPNSDIGPATKAKPRKARMLPTNDARAEMDSAVAAFPLSAIGCPSRVVIMAPGSPGILRRIAEIRPPYSAPR